MPLPSMEERYPLTSPALPTGVAVSSVKRDVEQERDAKKKGVAGAGMGGIEGGAGKEAKAPKMKKVVVRKR
jgi:signal recognition particle subunit SRP19